MSWIQTRNTLTPYIPLTDEARPLYKYIYRRKFHNVLKTVPRRYLFTYLLWTLQNSTVQDQTSPFLWTHGADQTQRIEEVVAY